MAPDPADIALPDDSMNGKVSLDHMMLSLTVPAAECLGTSTVDGPSDRVDQTMGLATTDSQTGHGHRVDAQDSDVVPPSDGAAVGALDINASLGQRQGGAPIPPQDVSSVSSQGTLDDDDLYMSDPGTGNASPVDREPAVSIDLVHRVQGMYRILDLVSETSSGGLGMNSRITYCKVIYV
jgi:hypothetical protein